MITRCLFWSYGHALAPRRRRLFSRSALSFYGDDMKDMQKQNIISVFGLTREFDHYRQSNDTNEQKCQRTAIRESGSNHLIVAVFIVVSHPPWGVSLGYPACITVSSYISIDISCYIPIYFIIYYISRYIPQCSTIYHLVYPIISHHSAISHHIKKTGYPQRYLPGGAIVGVRVLCFWL